jgi:hypothetical protein
LRRWPKSATPLSASKKLRQRAGLADDDTVVLRRNGAWRRPAAITIAACAALALISFIAWHALREQPALPTLPLATEADIAAEQPDTLTIHRFAANPRILVFDFPTLRQQGLMFDRIAAFAEKAGQPHDRVLTDAELAAALRASGDTVETYYYGHDYASATISRFFTCADRDRVALNQEEARLRTIATAQDLLADNADQAIITLPRRGADAPVDAVFRQTILHHELSHGEYFTDPAYADYAGHFWHDAMDDVERAAFTQFLVKQGYDPALRDLIVNETQAYLMFTPDPRVFSPQLVGLPASTVQYLRTNFRQGMPAGWLKEE